MPALIALLVCALFVGGVAYLAWRSRILFELEVRGGRLARARGRIPQRLLDEVLQVVPQAEDTHLIVRCMAEGNSPRLVTRGTISSDTLQRLRNVVGLWPLARLRTAPKRVVTQPASALPSDSSSERSAR